MTKTQHTEGRDRSLVAAFVSLADTLVDDFDVVEFLQGLTERTVELGLAAETGILLTDADGELRVMAASQERTRLLELFQLQSREGPCLDAFRQGHPIPVDDLAEHEARWPVFAPQALAVGFRSVLAVPMSLRGTRLGALNLFNVDVGAVTPEDQVVARGLADIATVGLLQQRMVRETQVAAEQLQHALHSRITIEQAKGVLAERRDIEVGEAFELLRSHARSTNTRITDLAGTVIAGRDLPLD
jgi:GAF domain-containing protein